MEDLTELGLSKNEAKVYSTLIKFGKMSASEVSAQSGVSYSRIYNVLEALIHKNLISILPEKTKKYVPESPESLMNLVNKKEEKLAKLKGMVGSLRKLYDVKEKNPVSIGIGQKAFYTLLKSMKEPSKFEYAIKWSSEYRPEWVRDDVKAMKKGIDVKMLSRYDNETKSNVDKWVKIVRNVKKFNNDGVAFSIRDDEVLISVIKSNSTILIKDTAFAKIMRQLFADSYKNAGEIKL